MHIFQDEWVGRLSLDPDAEGDETTMEWCGEHPSPDGPLYIWISVPRSQDVQEPSPEQLDRLHQTLRRFDEVKRLAVAYVRDDVQREPASYGLVDDGGTPYPTFPIPWTTATLEEYLRAFRLNQLGIPGSDEAEGTVYLAFETELDIEHGVAVEMHLFQPIHIGMVCDYGPMLML